MAILAQVSLSQQCGDHTAAREAACARRPAQNSTPPLKRRPITAMHQAFVISSGARSWCAPPPGLRPSQRRHPMARSQVSAMQPESGDQQQTAEPSEAAKNRGPEFPPFSTIQKGDVYDLRLYDSYPVVEMQYQRRDDGFLGLGSYFDGSNSERLLLKETQPIIMRYDLDRREKSMQLFIGSCRDGTPLEVPPEPLDPEVALDIAGGEMVAVLRFSGYAVPATAEAARLRLVQALEQDGIELADDEKRGVFRLAQYGQIHSLSNRLNEVMLRVSV